MSRGQHPPAILMRDETQLTILRNVGAGAHIRSPHATLDERCAGVLGEEFATSGAKVVVTGSVEVVVDPSSEDLRQRYPTPPSLSRVECSGSLSTARAAAVRRCSRAAAPVPRPSRHGASRRLRTGAVRSSETGETST
jgi:hypothetical protein